MVWASCWHLIARKCICVVWPAGVIPVCRILVPSKCPISGNRAIIIYILAVAEVRVSSEIQTVWNSNSNQQHPCIRMLLRRLRDYAIAHARTRGANAHAIYMTIWTGMNHRIRIILPSIYVN